MGTYTEFGFQMFGMPLRGEWRAAPREDKKASTKKISPIAAKAIGKIVAPYRAAAVLAALRFVSGAFSALFQFIQLRLLSFQQMLRP